MHQYALGQERPKTMEELWRSGRPITKAELDALPPGQQPISKEEVEEMRSRTLRNQVIAVIALPLALVGIRWLYDVIQDTRKKRTEDKTSQ